MVSYKTENISNVKDFIEKVEETKQIAENKGNNAELLFRGQNIDKPLLPKLARIKLNGSIENIEKLMLAEFERGIIPLSEFKPNTRWDLLALAQHHGLPTRLLDWSYSALIALWFAVENPPIMNKEGELENGVVWILSPKVDDFKVNKKGSPFTIKATRIFRSSVVSRRISSQAGVFSVHGISDDGKLIAFEKNKRYSKKLIKLIIIPSEFAKIRKNLTILGINSSTVFPDLDGFCKHLERRFSKLNDE